MVAKLRPSKHAHFLYGCAPLAEGLGFEAPRTRLHPLLSATTKVALPRDHEPGREEVGFAGRADKCPVRQCFPRFSGYYLSASIINLGASTSLCSPCSRLKLENMETPIRLEDLLGDTLSPILISLQNSRFLYGRLLLATSTKVRAVIQLQHTVYSIISIIWEGICRDSWVTKHKMSLQIISCCIQHNHSSYAAKFDFHHSDVETVPFRSRTTPYGKHHSVKLPMYASLGFFTTGVRQINSHTGYLQSATLNNFSYHHGLLTLLWQMATLVIVGLFEGRLWRTKSRW